MADNLYQLTQVLTHTGSGTFSLSGGLPAYWDYGSGADNDIELGNVTAPTYGSGSYTFDGAYDALLHVNHFLDGGYTSYRWVFSTSTAGGNPTFSLEFAFNHTSGDGIVYDNSYTANLYEGVIEAPESASGAVKWCGFSIWVISGELIIRSCWSGTQYATGLMVTGGDDVLLISNRQGRDYFVVGLNGNSYRVAEPYTGYCDHFFGNTGDSMYTAATGQNLAAGGWGFSGTIGAIRITSRVERWPDLPTGTGTYITPPTDFSDTTAPASIPVASIQVPVDEYGQSSGSLLYPTGITTKYRVAGITGGTPPYTYQWVCMINGDLTGFTTDGVTNSPTLEVNTAFFGEIWVYAPTCIIRDANGVYGYTFFQSYPETKTYVADTWQVIPESTVYARVGERAVLYGGSVIAGFHRSIGQADYAAMETTAYVEVAAPNGTLTRGQTYSPIDDDYVGDNGGANDAYVIDPVSFDDDGAAIRAVWNDGVERGQGVVRLKVIGSPTDGYGFWTELEDTEQTTTVTLADALKTFQEGRQATTDFQARPDFASLQSSWETWLNNLYVPSNRIRLTEHIVGQLAQYLYPSSPWLLYATSAPARVQPWQLNNDYEMAYAMAFELAYWSTVGDPGQAPTYLPLTGSIFQQVFNAAYRGIYEGAQMGYLDQVQVNPPNTNNNPDPYYEGPYRNEYLIGFADGYLAGYNRA